MKLIICSCVTLLLSCQINDLKEELRAEYPTSSCTSRPKFNFPDVTNQLDSNFIAFKSPIDSINKRIEMAHIKPTKFPYWNDIVNYKLVWRDHGNIIKIERYFLFDEKDIFHRYYIENNCHWFYERKEYYENHPDSLNRYDLFYFKDTTILNVFVGASCYEHAFMIKADSNRFNIAEGRKAIKMFANEINERL